MIGLGYYDTLTPAVIRRNILESPAWYTATRRTSRRSRRPAGRRCWSSDMVTDLTGLTTANASLLDEATAAAEAMALCHGRPAKAGAAFVVDADCFPQTIAVVQTRAKPLASP